MLALYCAAIFIASMAGAMVPRRMKMTHTRMQLVMSLVAGLMLGVALFHLIPHSATEAGSHIDFTMRWVMAGLVFMLMLLRLFHFHQHDFGDLEAGCEHGSAEAHDHAQAHDHAHASPPANASSWFGLAFGLAVHTIVDGIALGAVMQSGEAQASLLGVGVFMAIFLHKPLDTLALETVMTAAGTAVSVRRIATTVFSLLCPLAAVLFFLRADVIAGDSLLLPGALAFSAGAFICIALADLLPEVQFHSHDRGKLTVLFIVGIALAMTIGIFEPAH